MTEIPKVKVEIESKNKLDLWCNADYVRGGPRGLGRVPIPKFGIFRNLILEKGDFVREHSLIT